MKNEMLYYKLKELAANDDPLAWWRENELCFPLLAKLTKRNLCIATTSVPCECILSTFGSIVNIFGQKYVG